MKKISKLFFLTVMGLFLISCSKTYMMGSWSNPDLDKQIKSVYIVGMSDKELHRRIFEDTFNKELVKHGVQGVSSYNDLPENKIYDEDIIHERMGANGVDSVIMTQVIKQRIESVTSPGRISGYSTSPYYGGRGVYSRPNYYRNWGNYYNRRYDISYEPPTTSEFLVLTVESVLYDLKSGEMMWSGQLEAVVDGKIENLMQNYVKLVANDLKEKGLVKSLNN